MATKETTKKTTKKVAPKTATSKKTVTKKKITEKEIRDKAQAIYDERIKNGTQGNADSDWALAEKELGV